MPSQRGPNQKLLGFYADTELLFEIDKVRKGKSRSQWLRDAVRREMAAAGINLPDDTYQAPDRAGKGGRKSSAGRTLRGRVKVHENPKNIEISPGVDSVNSGNATGYPTPRDERVELNDPSVDRRRGSSFDLSRGMTDAERLEAARKLIGKARAAGRKQSSGGGDQPRPGTEGR